MLTLAVLWRRWSPSTRFYDTRATPLRWALAAGDHSARRQDFRVMAEIGGNAEDHGERSIPRRAACIATCVGFILIPFSFALNP